MKSLVLEGRVSSGWIAWTTISGTDGAHCRVRGAREVTSACNELACAKCHVGYGMESVKTFRFDDPRNVDRLPSVGRPGRSNCGVCHLYRT
jgi:hypothetical protein